MTSTHFEFEAIGTKWVIDCEQGISDQEVQAILERVNAFDKNYSRFREDSLLVQASHKAGTYTLPADGKRLFDMYKEAYDLTEGSVTPLIGDTLVAAGYDAEYSLQPGKLSKPPTWEEALVYDYPNLTLNMPVLLDVGAAGKGYLVDIVGDLLLSWGKDSFCVDAGGDMICRGDMQRIGLEHPEDATKAIGVVELRNKSLCGSAGNRRKWEGYHHILDPHSLVSPDTIRAVWAVADTAIEADMLTTCLFLGKGTEFASRHGCEYLILYNDYTVDVSPLFPAELFVAPAA